MRHVLMEKKNSSFSIISVLTCQSRVDMSAPGDCQSRTIFHAPTLGDELHP